MKKKIITHNAGFHSDDVFGVATLLILLDGDAEVIRTRDEEVIKTGDYVLDVGGIYDEDKNRFDHHQKEGAGERENGIPYASFGLIWKKFGEELSGSKIVAEEIDKKIVQGIDATDNGVDVFKSIISGVKPYAVWEMVGLYEPTWKEVKEVNIDDKFLEVVDFAKKILEREIKKTADRLEAERVVRDIYNNSEDKKLIILSAENVYSRTLINSVLVEFSEPIYFVYYGIDGFLRVSSVSIKNDTFETRKPLPENWRGKTGDELSKESGVDDAIFCHRSGFMCVAKSKEGAIKLAKMALEA